MITTEPTDTFLQRLAGGTFRREVYHQTHTRRNVILFRLEDLANMNSPYNRRDFYKVSLVFSPTRVSYADKQIDILQPALVFSNPYIPYSWEQLTDEQRGYCCLFTPSFFSNEARSHLRDSPLFHTGGTPVFFLKTQQIAYTTGIFERIQAEIETDYAHKEDLLQNLISLVLHEALKLQPATDHFFHKSAATRIADLFMELLNRQFPVDSIEHILQLKTPGDYARQLSVHVNHLNQAVKIVTGKTTSAHITDRILNEAKILLLHSDLNVADIGYCLGFEDPSSFNKSFKKGTGQSPSVFRQQAS